MSQKPVGVETEVLTIPTIAFDITIPSEKMLNLIGFENLVRLLPDSNEQVRMLGKIVANYKVNMQRRNATIRKLTSEKAEMLRQIHRLKAEKAEAERLFTVKNFACLSMKNELQSLRRGQKTCSSCFVGEFIKSE